MGVVSVPYKPLAACTGMRQDVRAMKIEAILQQHLPRISGSAN